METSLFLHGFSFELELINNENNLGPFHALIRHASQFQPYLGALSDEETMVMEEFNKFPEHGYVPYQFIKQYKTIIAKMQPKIVGFIKSTIHHNEHRRQYPIHKSGNKDKTLVTCWEIFNSTDRLILVISGWKGYSTNHSNVVERRALVTSYLVDEKTAVSRFSNLRYWFDDAGMVRIANCKDFRNELGELRRTEQQESRINPIPLLANIIDRTEVELLSYLFKEQMTELLNMDQPGFVKTYLSTLHFGVLIKLRSLSGANVQPHWRPVPIFDLNFLTFRSIIAFQYPLQGMLYSILRFGHIFSRLGFIKKDIIEIEKMTIEMRNTIGILREKQPSYRKFHRWYAYMDKSLFVDFSEFLQENEEVLTIQNEALQNITSILTNREHFLEARKNEENQNDEMKCYWRIPNSSVTLVATLSKENLAENSIDKPFRKVMRIEFENK